MTFFLLLVSFFFFNDTATTEIYTLSLHDALPISCEQIRIEAIHAEKQHPARDRRRHDRRRVGPGGRRLPRSEEHTSELQSQSNLVCRLLLEKKKKKKIKSLQQNTQQKANTQLL